VYLWSYSFTWPPIGLLLFHWLLVALVLIFFDLLPSVIAFVRKHHNRYAILVLNVLLGWTLVGGCACSIDSVFARRQRRYGWHRWRRFHK
jgi:hypothetical protein